LNIFSENLGKYSIVIGFLLFDDFFERTYLRKFSENIPRSSCFKLITNYLRAPILDFKSKKIFPGWGANPG
jgi:hypothetical protein